MSEKYLSTGQAAKHIGVDRTSLYRWELKGSFKPKKRDVHGSRLYTLNQCEKKKRERKQ